MALPALAGGEAPLPSRDPEGDFFFIASEDEEALAAKAVRLMAERVPLKLGLPADEASLCVTAGEAGPLGAGRMSLAMHAAMGGLPVRCPGFPGASPGLPLRDRSAQPPALPLRGRTAPPPGWRVLQAADRPPRGLFKGERGRVLPGGPAGPGSLAVGAAMSGRAVRYGPGELHDLLPAWAIQASQAPPWARFPAVVVCLGRGSERLLGRAGLHRAALLAERLLVIAGPPSVYARVLKNRTC
jgi:hypothetical protein